jgi:hypothetical protein
MRPMIVHASRSWAVILALAAWLLATASAPVRSDAGFVTVRGRELVDPDGRPLDLKGINLGGWLVPEGYMFGFTKAGSPRQIQTMIKELVGTEANNAFWDRWYRSFVDRDDIRYIRSTGMNVIRVPFDYRFFTPEDHPETWVDTGFELLDRVVHWSAEAGLYVILDMHAAPCGQNGTNIDNSYGYPHLFEDAACRTRATAVWRHIAEHYAHERSVIGYDLLNEPLPDKPEYRRYDPALAKVYKEFANAIREVDKDHILFVAGSRWGYNLDMFDKPRFDPKLVYTFHTYWSEPSDSAFQSLLQFSRNHDVPVFLGESGENSDLWIKAFRTALENHDIGWAFWTYKRMATTRSLRSFDEPPYWDELVSYESDLGASQPPRRRPTVAHVKAALDGILRNARFENTRANEGYVTALGLGQRNETSRSHQGDAGRAALSVSCEADDRVGDALSGLRQSKSCRRDCCFQ